ncbi:flagellar brake protein [Paenibacillus allorhizosphaerae]|uniref:PilZ domain-containing protein n=1 Tax=Paenibacillus allorhizosphaerae TaxID=2849866 RepID=A0ABN7TLB9_9BACL|nr:PilZ domain-containing protein [Paenibacillus allorhizosphaerae]CAG7645256.1 hypothetical protein PAECIP111802_03470 [Paenibacillus allorhizosphaerae]
MSNQAKKVEFWNNQLIELHTYDKEIYMTQIMADVNDLFIIQRPVNNNNTFMPVTDGFPITVYFHDQQQGLCTFDSTICLYKNKLAVVRPAMDAIKKAHRRRFFRVPVETEVSLSTLPADNQEAEPYGTYVTHDLSGGGLSFLCPHKLEEGELVAGSLQLDTARSRKSIAFTGKIINNVKIRNKRYKVSLEFTEVKEAVRSDIIRFCNFKQIELRNKLRNYSLE